MTKTHLGLTALALVLGVISVDASTLKRFAVTYTVNGKEVGLPTVQTDCPGSVGPACGHTRTNGEVTQTWFFED